MTILKAIRHHVSDNRIRRRYEKIEKAIREKAQLVSDMEFHRTMSNFYTERVLEIDPHSDWWGFADAKQKQHDHQIDFTRYSKAVQEADAKVIASKAAFLATQPDSDENSFSN